MLREIRAKIIRNPISKSEDDVQWDNKEQEYKLFSINKYNLLFIVPGETEDHAFVYLTDGTVLKTYDPYPYIKGKFNEFPLYYN